MAKHHQNQIFAWGNLAVLGPEVGSWSYSRRREEHLDGGECGGGGGGVPHLPSFFQECSLGLFSSRASQVTFRLRIKRSLGLTGWRTWAGRWLLLPLCPALASHTDYNFPFTAVLRRLPPARHCLIVCRGKLLEEINLPLTRSWEFLYQSPLGMPGEGQSGVCSRQYQQEETTGPPACQAGGRGR